ncbi:hypothetical protein GLIP_0422 [Aliiglaciecola lipolytica E3]|uniref:Uncharacterized protein n=1 Tax=Aliiglaciecola lipolytica E3 TaxID=1127673 RepID=K6WX87_9ALTE|nr:hypothetical protein GLIP_0422 [Aliiglaciecola lipolytica E3]
MNSFIVSHFSFNFVFQLDIQCQIAMGYNDVTTETLLPNFPDNLDLFAPLPAGLFYVLYFLLWQYSKNPVKVYV